MRRKYLWEFERPGDWTVRNANGSVYSIRLPCLHDGHLRVHTVTHVGDRLDVREAIICTWPDPNRPECGRRYFLRGGALIEVGE